DSVVISISDGYLSALTNGTAELTSASYDFSTIPDILNKRIEITAAENNSNNGIYDIVSVSGNTLTITNIYSNLIHDQISVIKLSDGKEIFSYSGIISDNKIILPSNASLSLNDKVFLS